MDPFTLILFRFPDDARVAVTDGLGQRSLMTLGEAVARYKIVRSHWCVDAALLRQGYFSELGLRVALLEFKVGAWTIHYDPPPIPVRDCDWHATHDNFDASWEGEEDGYVSNGLAVSAASPGDCLREIADLEEDRAMPRTLEAA